MIRINGTYPTDSIREAGLSTTDDSLFIVSLVHALRCTLTVNLKDVLLRQGNVLIFSERRKLLQTKRRTSWGRKPFSIFTAIQNLQKSSTTEQENQYNARTTLMTLGNPKMLRGGSWTSSKAHFLLETYRHHQLEPKTQQNQLLFLPVWTDPPALTYFKQQGEKIHLLCRTRQLYQRPYQTAAHSSHVPASSKLPVWDKAVQMPIQTQKIRTLKALVSTTGMPAGTLSPAIWRSR